jgi:PAS domain S-box-containing protein
MKKILVIDDVSENLIAIKESLEDLIPDCLVLTAQTGKEGLKIAREEQLDTIITDMIMPGMNGCEICKKIIEDKELKNIPVVILSGSKTDTESRIKCLEAGADIFLSKPIDPAELSAQINVMFRIKEAEDKLRAERELLDETVQKRTEELEKANNMLKQDIANRKKSERILKESEERYRRLFNSSKDAIMTLTPPDWKFTSGNSAIMEMFKTKNIKEFIKLHPLDVSPEKQPDGTSSAEKARIEIQKAMKNGSNFFEWTHKRLDGGNFLATVLLTKVDLADRSFLQATVRDITERKKAEKALRESEEKYKELINNQGEGFGVVDTDEQFKFVNPAAENIFGVQPGKLVGRNIKDFVNPEQFKLVQKETQKRKKGKKSVYELEVIRPDKEIRNILVTATPHFDSEKKLIEIFGVFRDITKRKKTELALQESENRYKYLFEQSPVSIWEEDFSEVYKYLNSLKKKGIRDLRNYFEKHLDEVDKCSQMVRILDINEITTKLYNTKSKNELITNLDSIFIKDSLPAFIEQLCTIAQNKTHFNGESINKTLDGRLINVALKWNVVPGYEKDYSKVLVSLIDVTEQKKAEEEIRNSKERLKIMNKILRHDLANDFVVIGSALRLYKSNSETVMLNEIEKRVTKSLDTIKRVREQESFIDSHSYLNKYDITEVLNEIIADFPAVNIYIEGSGTAFADEALYSVFENLINNAIKHGNSKKIDVSISTNEQFCEIRFKDFGTGIPDEIKDKVFDEGFVHGKKGNTGIGLYIVKQTIEGYGGKITVEDNKPNGAIFVINLRKVI